MPRPDFIIIGAMKCATSTLHDQLAAQPGVFMTTPKEPCFFSDDQQWQRGLDWYHDLFADAAPGDVCGESSTHYTKRPTHPDTVARMAGVFGDRGVKFIYMMRHPIDRLVSQYIHEWSQGTIPSGVTIDEAIDRHPELVAYGRYAHQLRPYRDTFGPESILPVFFERFVSCPQEELARVAAFIGLPTAPHWHDDLSQRNASSERVRRHVLRDAILGMPGVRPLIRKVVPQATRHRILRAWSMQQRPELLPATRDVLETTYDEDLAVLGRWLGLSISCNSFSVVASETPATWSIAAAGACP